MNRSDVYPDDPSTSDTRASEAMREKAYRLLRHMLILQQIPGGKRLREAEWAAKLNVNRSALREAFARLEAQGLIEAGQKTGYVVPVLDKTSISEILAVRIMLETGAIEIVCGTGLNTAAHLQSMQDACEELSGLATHGSLVQVVEADWRFHNALVYASGNHRLRSVYHHAPLPLIVPEETSGPVWEASVRRTVQEHKTILAAILEGDAAQAIKLLRGHISERSMHFAESVRRNRGSAAT